MDMLLGVDFAVAEKDRLYRCLDRMLEHKQELFVHLQQRWKNLFDAQFDVLLYDLTSTYLEGEASRIRRPSAATAGMAGRIASRSSIALVITPEGFPLAYEVMDGNTSDKTTLRGFLSKIEGLYGKARRVWLMDRGIPTEAILAEMREHAERQMFYLVGTSKARVNKYEKQWLESALAQSPRLGAGEAVQPRRRIVCAGQKRRPAGKRDCHAAQETGATAAEVA